MNRREELREAKKAVRAQAWATMAVRTEALMRTLRSSSAVSASGKPEKVHADWFEAMERETGEQAAALGLKEPGVPPEKMPATDAPVTPGGNVVRFPRRGPLQRLV